MRDTGEGAVDFLTACPNRDAPVLPPEPCKLGSGSITGNEPPQSCGLEIRFMRRSHLWMQLPEN
jgi:hypothetical protein